MKTFVLTDIPSPYQVELFNEIAAQKTLALSVAYLRNSDPNRLWRPANAQHDCRSIGDSRESLSRAEYLAVESELAIFNYYNHPVAERLIRQRATTGKPWCFWGERPGLRRPNFAGQLFRRWKLKSLRESRAPIWGIGEFALQQYKREFGFSRIYKNLPYFSNLDRFNKAGGFRGAISSRRVFLFCGSLSVRKGVDLVARAFVQLAREFPNVSLKIVGEGKLREAVALTLRPVQERVELVGFKDWSELPELYASADVLCVPSRYDGWGLVVPEGLASGLPVIATDRMGAALEFVRTDQNGWLVPAGDEVALLRAMREAVLMPHVEFDAMGQRARASVSEHTLAHGVERFVRYARECVASPVY